MLRYYVLVLFVKPILSKVAAGFRPLLLLLLWTPATRVVFVASVEEVTRGKNSQKDYKGKWNERWNDGHGKLWSPRLAPNNRVFS
jgi:hypothetical protein